MTAEEKSKIVAEASAAGLSASEFMRRASLRRKIGAAPREIAALDPDALRELARIGKNLNQIARSFAVVNKNVREGRIESGAKIEAQLRGARGTLEEALGAIRTVALRFSGRGRA